MPDSIYIIDYGAGNLHSIAKSVEAVAGGRAVNVGHSPQDMLAASHVILPGVGAFGDCVAGLKAQPGVLEAMTEHAIERQKPFLGICVGMQMLADKGLEHGEHQGLGWIPGVVRPIPVSDGIKIPHMGWNNLEVMHPHPVLAGLSAGDHAYFVHSYYFDCENDESVLSSVEYGVKIPAVIAKIISWQRSSTLKKAKKQGFRC